jgi:putative ABC transport system permease protein
MMLTALCVTIGIVAASWLARFVASFLFGVDVRDPLAFVFTPVLLSAVALVATWIPAVRATNVDALTALHFE